MIKVLLVFLVFLNVLTFLFYAFDRLIEKKRKRGNTLKNDCALFVLVCLGGSIGAWMGMQCWKHPSKHRTLRYSIPSILALQVLAFIYCRYTM